MATALQEAIRSAEDMQAQLISRAQEDDTFRSQLVEDPRAAIRQEFGIEVPDFVNINVYENTGGTTHIVLPMQSDKVQLDEKILEQIAAGLSCCG